MLHYSTTLFHFGFQTPSKEWISEAVTKSATEVIELDLYRDKNYKLSNATRRDVIWVCYLHARIYYDTVIVRCSGI